MKNNEEFYGQKDVPIWRIGDLPLSKSIYSYENYHSDGFSINTPRFIVQLYLKFLPISYPEIVAKALKEKLIKTNYFLSENREEVLSTVTIGTIDKVNIEIELDSEGEPGTYTLTLEGYMEYSNEKNQDNGRV